MAFHSGQDPGATPPDSLRSSQPGSISTAVTRLPNSNLLRKFPPEIRNKILDFYFAGTKTEVTSDSRTPHLIAALRQDKDIYEEALAFYYKRHLFEFNIDSIGRQVIKPSLSLRTLNTIRHVKVIMVKLVFQSYFLSQNTANSFPSHPPPPFVSIAANAGGANGKLWSASGIESLFIECRRPTFDDKKVMEFVNRALASMEKIKTLKVSFPGIIRLSTWNILRKLEGYNPFFAHFVEELNQGLGLHVRIIKFPIFVSRFQILYLYMVISYILK